jgi:lipoic acid synthetase
MTTLTRKQSAAQDKLSRIPVKIQTTEAQDRKRLPEWFYRDLPRAHEGNTIAQVKHLLREKRLSSVCEEASCPNLSECFHKGTATFMIMGDTCTRRCTFCDVKHGKPNALDAEEPKNLAESIQIMGLKYVVVTSVDRDDLKDGGGSHFAECIQAIRELTPHVKIEILVPDFRGRMDKALAALSNHPPDVFNHNLETVPRLYRAVRPGSDYQYSLDLLKTFKAEHPDVLTKSGLMIGLGETNEEILEVLKDCKTHQVDMITMGQYLQPTKFHTPVDRYLPPEGFQTLGTEARAMGFTHVASGPLVRSSYHADLQFENKLL